jgi:hypothetical protein
MGATAQHPERVLCSGNTATDRGNKMNAADMVFRAEYVARKMVREERIMPGQFLVVVVSQLPQSVALAYLTARERRGLP